MLTTLIVILAVAVALLFISLAKLERSHNLLCSELQKIKQRVIDIDPQFEDERVLQRKFNEEYQTDKNTLSGMAHSDLIAKKQSQGKPTLLNPF